MFQKGSCHPLHGKNELKTWLFIHKFWSLIVINAHLQPQFTIAYLWCKSTPFTLTHFRMRIMNTKRRRWSIISRLTSSHKKTCFHDAFFWTLLVKCGAYETLISENMPWCDCCSYGFEKCNVGTESEEDRKFNGFQIHFLFRFPNRQ